MVFPPLGNSDHWLSQFPFAFCQTQNGIPRFIAYPMTILVLIGMVLLII